jgi:hypothetical protein
MKKEEHNVAAEIFKRYEGLLLEKYGNGDN